MFSFIKTSYYTTNISITIHTLLSNFWISRFTRSFALPCPAPLEKAPTRTSLSLSLFLNHCNLSDFSKVGTTNLSVFISIY